MSDQKWRARRVELIIFGGDSSHCYFSPKLKITRTLGTTVQKGLALFARCQPPFPRKYVKRNFVPREKDNSDPNGRCHHPKEERNPFCSFSKLFKRRLFSQKANNFATRRGKSTAPNTLDQYPCYRDEEKQLTKGPISYPRLFLVEGRRAGKEFRREYKDLFAVKGFFPLPVILR